MHVTRPAKRICTANCYKKDIHL